MRVHQTPEYMLKNARNLRRNQTAEERKLWYQCLCNAPIRFWRQKIFGNYIADFCAPKAKLIVELDGSQHYEEDYALKDKERDSYFSSLGYTVLRYSNNEINLQFESVCNDIYKHLGLLD